MNILKWIPAIVNAMNLVEKIKKAKGKDKLAAVLESLPSLIDDIDARDVIDHKAVQDALINAINAIKNLENVVTAAKKIKK